MSTSIAGSRPVDRSRHLLLVVNDDPVGRYTTVRQLKAAGFQVEEASTGAEALRLADERISAVILDIHLPDIDGFEVCRRLRANPATFRVPVLHLTAAYVTDEDKVRGLDSGADAYLTHPVEPAVLVSNIQALVRTRAAEEGMRRSEAKFRAVYEHSPVGIGLLDAESGVLLGANPALLALLGRPLREVVGRPLLAFVAPGNLLDAQGFLHTLQGEPASAEFGLVGPRGGVVPIEWSSAPHVEPGVCMVMGIDISPRLQLVRQRQEMIDRERSARGAAESLARTKDDLIAVLSHELRTPLHAVLGWTHVLQKRDSPELLQRGLAAIERNVTLQARMISDMLDMSRMNVGKLAITPELVEAGAVVADAIAAVQPSLETSGHVLSQELRDGDCLLHADRGRLQQVIWNLIGNAIKFSPKGSRILVTMARHDDGLRIQVVDEGQGIAPDFLPQIFERFTQNDQASNRRHGGLGLGLSIVKHLVELHGGRVGVTSAGRGRGSCFEIWLPEAQPGEGNAAIAAESELGELDTTSERPGPLQGLSVLVVDDDAEASAMLKLILGARGAIVTAVDSADAALRALATSPLDRPFDLLVSDVGMPGRDGYELIRTIREWERPGMHLPAIALTAFSREADQSQARDAGFDAHVGKPLRPQELLRLMVGLIG